MIASSPVTSQQLFVRLDALGISHHTIDHPPLFTVEQSRQLRGDLPGAHSKNLFLRNKKGRMWLLTCLEYRKFDLKSLGTRLGTGGLSFCSTDRLMRYLGVIPGAVTPFAVINDVECVVQVVLDQGLCVEDPLNFHPLDNSKTTSIGSEDLIRYLHAVDHPPIFLDFETDASNGD